MSLPNPGMDAVPFTPLTAEFLDDMIENIEALSNGTGLATNAVTADKIATNANVLGYVQITSNAVVASSATPTQVPSLTLTVTVPSGGRRVRITAFAPGITTSSANQYAQLQLWSGTVNSGTLLSQGYFVPTTAGYLNAMTVTSVLTPSTGSKTYNVGVVTGAAASVSVAAGATYPSYLLVEVL